MRSSRRGKADADADAAFVKALCKAVALVVAVTPMTGNSLVAVASAATLPATLPTNTRTIDYTAEGYSGTIPTEFGLLTEAIQFNIAWNAITGPIPTEIGRMTAITRGGAIDIDGTSLRHAHPPCVHTADPTP